MQRLLLLVLGLLVLLVGGGCAAASPQATHSVAATATRISAAATAPSAGVATTAATAGAKGEPQREGAAVLVYRRTGGFAGVDESWTVYEDGRVVDAAGKEAAVDVTALADVIAEARLSGFFDLQLAVDRKSVCADCFTYQLELSVGEQRNAVAFKDAQEDVPEAIWNLLASVQALVAR